MGKIYRGSNVSGERYVVAVPRVAPQPDEYPAPGDFNDRFDASFDARDPFTNAVASTYAAPAEPQIDWDALRADAEAIVDRASADAQRILEEAQRSAQQIVDQAHAQAQLIESDASTRGHDAGFAAGKAAADDDMAEMTQTMHGLLAEMRDARHEYMETAEPEIVRLAMAVAERILHEQITIDPNVVVENVRSALTRLVTREAVTLRVNPADLETMRQHREAIISVTDIEHLRIVEDQRVDRGGVVIETDAGTIDAKIATQLREARRAIRADDGIALGPSHDEQVLHPPAQAS